MTIVTIPKNKNAGNSCRRSSYLPGRCPLLLTRRPSCALVTTAHTQKLNSPRLPSAAKLFPRLSLARGEPSVVTP
jgi:hypothetical protein